ncbi:hypothetical protein [Priestia koreensis]|uniref:hypothetical protein n=1 Tax=Priestia koreensis TaxID=284581 RepID=UPI001F58196C|nr:hypothetical protein [Priestia koreensis]UNL86485.1 hypothetical protein IE339_08360 [Priestia koreensis]
MHGIWWLVASLIILIIIPFSLKQDIKKGKKRTDLFINNCSLAVVFLVTIAQFFRSILSSKNMHFFDQLLLLTIVFFVVLPLVGILIFRIKEDIKKWQNPREYKLYFLYKIRYALIAMLAVMVAITGYRFYVIFKVVFA